MLFLDQQAPTGGFSNQAGHVMSYWHHLRTNWAHHATLVAFNVFSETNNHPQVVSATKLAMRCDIGTI
jgi:hypothetical protein